MKSPILEHFRVLPDPRKAGHGMQQHALLDIVVITVLAVICGADTWIEIHDFGVNKKKWLQQFLILENGIPSHDTFGRVFSVLDPQAFQKCFFEWTQTLRETTHGEVVALDGKTIRRAHTKGGRPIHIVSAFATANGIALGQLQVDAKTNEITVIPNLLDMLMLKGCIVTTDAMGCQGWIVKKIVENKGEYVLAVKGNQDRLLRDTTAIFDKNITDTDYVCTSEKAHGREEIRECWVSTNMNSISDIEKWDGLKSVARITDTRTINGKKTIATRYFISSLKQDAGEILRVVRAHWKVENSLHYTLDIAFREDESRIRIGHAARNLALVRKLALNLLRREKTATSGVKAKRLQAGWSNEYLLKVLEGGVKS